MKLYWRVKKNGKWTWEPFSRANSQVDFNKWSGWKYRLPPQDEGARREHGNGDDPEPLE